MLEKIIAIDKDLLVFLNGLGSEFFDGFWLTITVQEYWTPFFLLVFYFLAKKIGWKNFLIALVFIALLILVSDQTSNFFKNHFQRLRPCNDLDLKNIIRIVKPSDSYSFFSGHATNSMATTVFVFLIIRRYYKYALLLFLFPLIFAFSRIYLGLHFPTDILTGYAFGATFGFVFYKIYQKYILKD
ncbi:phosphatase PAP2 family protein [Flavobacterium chungnamense]|uniref:Phosphatase PAP2 family protein n=1 Tax=Flavobacterium chungnamense TaxID=706182 RepID=A0ABP7UQB7_9FLAO